MLEIMELVVMLVELVFGLAAVIALAALIVNGG
jgi:hypothetical protein